MWFFIQKAFEHASLPAPELGFAMQGEDVRNGKASGLLDLIVAVVELAVEPVGEPFPDR